NFEGSPIAGATLSMGSSMTPAMFASRTDASSLSATADDTGYYRFVNISPGKSWHLSAGAASYGTQTKRNLRINAKTDTNNHDFRLSPGEKIRGMVIGPDRSPIGGASVRVIGYQEPQTLSQDTESGPDGKFEIGGLVGGDYALIVKAEGWGVSQRNRIEAPLQDIEIEMAEQGSVMGHVVDDVGNPIGEFTLGLHQYIAQSSTYGRRSQQKKFSSADGSFTLTGVSEGRYGVKVEAAGFAATYSEDFEVSQGLATTDILVSMNQGGRITGTVLDATSGKPLKGVTIMTQDNNFQDNPFMRLFAQSTPRRTSENKTRTDKDGNFELMMLAPELYQIQVVHPSYPTESVNNLRVNEGQATEMGTIQLQSGGTVRGTVFDGAGQALPGATVQLISVNRDQTVHIEARTSAEGRYILRNVPAGSFKLSAASASDENNVFQPIVDMQNSEVLFKVDRGQEYTQDLNLGG
ncbi:MAG: 5-hydroxyisourate hydrolase-like protein (transthyretin family), partial [Planctomycetota bacterium]